MDSQMEEAYEKLCVFEESFDIDFEYEFDVAMYFDFLHPETIQEIKESENWFDSAQGHPPSPFLLKFGLGTKELGGSDTSSPKYAYSMTDDGGESEALYRNQGKKGPALLKSKSTNQPCLSKNSRLLQPTASLLAKQNHHISVRETRAPGRPQKLGSPLKSLGDVAATKRQKLEHGYLCKVAHLKHQTNFSHKLPKKVGSSNVNSCNARLKVTVPKEPSLETANRAQRYRSKNATELSQYSKYDGHSIRVRPSNTKISEPKLKRTQSLAPDFQGGKVRNAKGATINGRLLETKRSKSFNASMQKECDRELGLKSRPLMKKESKGTNNKKLSQTPPTELFSQLSLNSENQMSLAVEDDLSLLKKGLKKNVRCMKENKNATTITGKTTRSCLKQSQIGQGRMTVIGNQPTGARSMAIH